MTERSELIWRVSGIVVETTFNLGRKDKPFWQIEVKIDTGFVCLYVRENQLRQVAESLQIGDRVVASGSLNGHREAESAKRPLFLDPVTQLTRIDA